MMQPKMQHGIQLLLRSVTGDWRQVRLQLVLPVFRVFLVLLPSVACVQIRHRLWNQSQRWGVCRMARLSSVL